MNVVLLEPEIPANTGNIGRTCVATGAILHLIRPLGFSTDDKYLKRAGMDYWSQLDVRYYENFTDFLQQNHHPPVYMTSSKARLCYTDMAYPPGSYIMFGKESAGIPEDILVQYPDFAIRIPMCEGARCINLSSSVAVVLYEALRQQGFAGLSWEGKLQRLTW